MAIIFPELRLVGYILIAAGLVPLVWWALNKLLPSFSEGWRPSIGASLLIIVGGGLGALCVFAGLAMIHFQHQSHLASQPTTLAKSEASAQIARRPEYRALPVLKTLAVEISQSPRWDVNLIATINNDGDIPLRNISGDPSVKVVFSKIRAVPAIGDSRNVDFDDEGLPRALPDIPSKSTEDLIFKGRDGIITASADFAEQVPLPNELFATLDLNMSDDFGGTYTFGAKGYLNMRGGKKFIGSFPLEIIERTEVEYKGPEQ